MTIRLIVCLDVDTNDLAEAYATVCEAMEAACINSPKISWESSDEWYAPDGPGDPSILQDVTDAYWRDKSVWIDKLVQLS